MFSISFNLIRYLFVLRVNRPIVWLSDVPAAETSLVLGNAIADRLPTALANPWRKCLSVWNEDGTPDQSVQSKLHNIPDASWPLESVIFFYPCKQTYGEGERILWELKLMGDDADHAQFLEIILPAIEDLTHKQDTRQYSPNALWGQFDIDAVYVAKGMQWEPIVREGRLDLGYQVTPFQWAEGLFSNSDIPRNFEYLRWITPFDLSDVSGKTRRIPTLKQILDALSERMAVIVSGKYAQPDAFEKLLNGEEISAFRSAIKAASRMPVFSNNIRKAPHKSPGRWIGDQRFVSPIPESVIPYLELASVFHIGKYTHFGCGTFLAD